MAISDAKVMLLAVVAALAAAPAPAVGAESPAKLRSVFKRAMNAAPGASGAYVYDTADRKVLYARREGKPRILASNTKLFTTAAALDLFGARGRLLTEVLGDREPGARGVVRGNLYLRGGGDPSFGSASFTTRAYGGGGATVEQLARAVERAGIRQVTGGILGDETLFDSLRGGPESGYETSPWVGPLSALGFNRGLARETGSAFQRHPPQFAAKQLTAALKRRGVRIGQPAGARAASATAVPLADLESMPVARLIRLTNKISDNYFAEVFSKHLGTSPSRAGTTAAGAAAAERFASGFGIEARLVDGSGLSRGNRAAPRAIVKLLRAMRRHSDARAFYDSLAVAGEDGTLYDRMETGPAHNRCRAKTGTVYGVSALSGYCRALSGDLLAFSIVMNSVGSVERARDLQDWMSHAMARYG